jgi:FlaA1/EpsC-like NDP-sugar epimerase
VLIVGAGRMGEAATRYIFSGSDRRMRLVGFVDDDAFKGGKLVHGHQVLGLLDELPRIYATAGFHRILIAADDISKERLAMVKAFGDTHHLPVQRFSIEVNEFVPAVANGVNGNGAEAGEVSTGASQETAPAVVRPSTA